MKRHFPGNKSSVFHFYHTISAYDSHSKLVIHTDKILHEQRIFIFITYYTLHDSIEVLHTFVFRLWRTIKDLGHFQHQNAYRKIWQVLRHAATCNNCIFWAAKCNNCMSISQWSEECWLVRRKYLIFYNCCKLHLKSCNCCMLQPKIW